MVGAISFRYSWTTGMKKKFRNLNLKKGQISGLAQIDIFSDFLVLGVANFRINYLNYFIPVVQEYLNEISPTLHGPNKLKTSGKPLRIADLQPPALGQDNPATL